MARQTKARFELGTFAAVVFNSPHQRQVSPVVTHHWKQPVADLLVKSQAPFTTSDVSMMCARFVGSCYSQPEVDTFLLSLLQRAAPRRTARAEGPGGTVYGSDGGTIRV